MIPYIPYFYTQQEADELFEFIKAQPFVRPPNPRNKTYRLKRLSFPGYSPPQSPRRAGRLFKSPSNYDASRSVAEAPELYRKFTAKLSEYAGKEINYLSTMGYLTDDHMDFHQHEEDKGREDQTVWVLSLGAVHPVAIRPKGCKDKSQWEIIHPKHGSLYVLPSSYNLTHEHAVLEGDDYSFGGLRIAINTKHIPAGLSPDEMRKACSSPKKFSEAWQAALDKFQKREGGAADDAEKLAAELGWAEPEPEEVVHRLLRDYVAAAARHHKRRGFPYVHKELTIAHKAKELHALVEYDHSKLIREGKIGWAKYGLKLANSYFPHMWSVRCRKSRTSVELFENDSLFPKAIMSRMKWGAFAIKGKSAYRLSFNEIRKGLRNFSGTQSVSNFRPTAAAAIYDQYMPEEGGVTWDMSMGWGGRMLGALACKKVHKYIGCDPFTETFKGLLKMQIELLPMARQTDRKLELELHQLGSETKEMRDLLPECGVDLCFTSQPYFERHGIVENYSTEPTQSHIRFPERESWLEGFVGQTIRNCYVALKPGGILALNVSDHLAEAVTDQALKNGFAYIETLWLRLSKNMGSKHKPGGPWKTEPVLIFRKP